ncbi:hypothetical protein, partial [Bradyrhizobium brasilense]|uniref:hypothetical protein n=1 Tax=Bradyrhizobium brasilense TaxID=1419277 RepID=UPI001E4A89C2
TASSFAPTAESYVSSAIRAKRAKFLRAVEQVTLARGLIELAGGMICHCVDGRAGQVLRTSPLIVVPRPNIPIHGSPTTDLIGETFLEASVASIRSLRHLARSFQQDRYGLGLPCAACLLWRLW